LRAHTGEPGTASTHAREEILPGADGLGAAMSATTPRPDDLARSAALPARRPWLRLVGSAERLPGRLRRFRLRLLVLLAWVALAAALGTLAARETRTSALQSQLLSSLNARLAFTLSEGPSPSFVAPHHGPYDQRLGYVDIPEWTARLAREGFRVTEQTRFSPVLARLTALGFSPPYHEKTRAGLTVRDRAGSPVFAVVEPAQGYADFSAIPPLVRDTLLFVENRELLDAEPRRNPAVEWDRLARAALFQLGGGDGDSRGPGGSTLATQMEKYRHSPGGRTHSPLEKLRQIGSASLRAYRDGEDTRAVRQIILLDYLNSLPLAAAAGRGEVLGLAGGLETWYAADFDRTNELLAAPVDPRDPAGLAEQADAYRRVLSLLLATRRPTDYLRGDDPSALDALADRYLRRLAQEGVISPELCDAALAARPRRVAPPAIAATSAGPAEPVRRWLVGALSLPDYYALDRLDLDVSSTLDARLQEQVEARLAALADPDVVAAAGLRAKGLLENADPARVIYSFALYERVGETSRLRVSADNYDGALDVNEGVKLDLGSTAKLRALVSYLEAIATLHEKLAGSAPEALAETAANGPDPLTRFVAETLEAKPETSLEAMLDAALERRYSASPWPGFYTGGGLHYFHNFNKEDSKKILSVRTAFRDSVNLPFVRLMRDLVAYHVARLPGDPAAMLRDRDDPRRAIWLRRSQEEEARLFLARFYRSHAGKSAEESLAEWIARAHPTPKRLAAAHRSILPEKPFEEFAAAVTALPAGATLGEPDLRAMYDRYGRDRFSLADRAFLARMHPLELWLIEWLREHPDGSFDEAIAASGDARDAAYVWLFQTRNRGAQDRRLRTLLERDAFMRIHREWKKLGYPFGTLAPSYATAIGSSGDRPSALAELIGIIAAGGMRLPSVRVKELRFGAGTPYETALAPAVEASERVLRPEVARALRGALLDVVGNGTARRASGAFRAPDGTPIALGGKTGTGDHQKKRVDRWANVLDSEYVSRTATFVFFVGDRFHGVVTAHVEGPESAEYAFTSSLPAQVLRQLAPLLTPVITAPPGVGDAATTVARR
jgi:membrane peptidoglycan carboxypeptidase